MVNRTATPKMTAGRAALLGLMHRYLAGLMDVSISLLELHKLMYLLQEAGEPLRLRYAKGPYGPYAQNLRHVLSAIEGHFTTGFGEAINHIDMFLPGSAATVLFWNEEVHRQAVLMSAVRLYATAASPTRFAVYEVLSWRGRLECCVGGDNHVAHLGVNVRTASARG